MVRRQRQRAGGDVALERAHQRGLLGAAAVERPARRQARVVHRHHVLVAGGVASAVGRIGQHHGAVLVARKLRVIGPRRVQRPHQPERVVDEAAVRGRDGFRRAVHGVAVVRDHRRGAGRRIGQRHVAGGGAPLPSALGVAGGALDHEREADLLDAVERVEPVGLQQRLLERLVARRTGQQHAQRQDREEEQLAGHGEAFRTG